MADSLAKKAVRGAAWTIMAGLLSRIVGVFGTLLLTRFLAPEVMGQVAAATAVVFMANTLSYFGFNHYLIVKGKEGQEAVFHATFYHYLLGIISLGTVSLIAEVFVRVFHAPDIALYIRGMALAFLLRRFAGIPDKVLSTQMKFRQIALAQAAGELIYTATAVSLVIFAKMGGEAILIGNIVQAAILLALMVSAAGFSWLKPTKLTWLRTKDVFKFGTPLAGETILHYGARQWDKMVFAICFGPAALGEYQLGYSLADIPATQIGEQIGGVLLPSLAKLKPNQRASALVRSTALLAILIFPMAVGLGVISESLIAAVLNKKWQGVGPLLMVLSVVSVFRPVTWVIASYMHVQERTPTMMLLEAFKVVTLLGSIFALRPFGPVIACFGVGIGFGVQAIAMVIVLKVQDNIPPIRFLKGFFGPLLACIPMAATVFGVRYVLRQNQVHSPILSLIAEITIGGLVYVPSAYVLANETARDFLRLIKKSFFSRWSKPEPEEKSEEEQAVPTTDDKKS
jgi:lipopolysaccharide exporter